MNQQLQPKEFRLANCEPKCQRKSATKGECRKAQHKLPPCAMVVIFIVSFPTASLMGWLRKTSRNKKQVVWVASFMGWLRKSPKET